LRRLAFGEALLYELPGLQDERIYLCREIQALVRPAETLFGISDLLGRSLRREVN